MNLSVNSNFGKLPDSFSGAAVVSENTSVFKTGSFCQKTASGRKKLNYNAKEISSQLLRASKSRIASSVLSRAKRNVGSLQRCLNTGEYDDSEVRIALAHAKRMVKCAQLKVANLKVEETLIHKYEKEKADKKRQHKYELKRRISQKEQDLKQKAMAEEIQQVQKEKSRRLEIIRKSRRHRNDEQAKISEADMKYLQNTLDCKHYGNHSQTNAISVELSGAGIRMSELQQMETQINAQTAVSDSTAAIGNTVCSGGVPEGGTPNITVSI